MPIYMKFDGAKPAVPGNVKGAGRAGWVEVDSLQFAGGSQGMGNVGTSRGRSEAPRLSEIIFTMRMNASAQALWSNAVEGTSMKVSVDFLSGEGKPSELYLSITLEQAMLSSFSMSGSGSEGRPTVQASMNFTKATSEAKGKAAAAP